MNQNDKTNVSDEIESDRNASSVPDLNMEYRRDIEGCADYLKGGALEDSERRFDEISTNLVDEENGIRQEGFGKLNLPEEELLKTETNSERFPELNKPVKKTEHLDKATTVDSIKSSTARIFQKTKSFFSKVAERREQRIQNASISILPPTPEMNNDKESGFLAEVTHIRDVLKKEPELKTIEEMKKPELVSYPILAPKTVEVIQENESENVESEMKEIKEIVEADVKVEKELPKSIKPDPFVDTPPLTKEPNKSPESPENPEKAEPRLKRMVKRGVSAVSAATVSMFKKWADSDKAMIATAIGIGSAMIVACIAKRRSFFSYRTIADLQKHYRSPFHLQVLPSVQAKGNISIQQIPFPRYWLSSSIRSTYESTDNRITLSLLAVIMNPDGIQVLQQLIPPGIPQRSKSHIFYYPSDINNTLPDSVLYGDISVKGYGSNIWMKKRYHSVSKYLVKMGICSIDRDINLDINSMTKKYMQKMNSAELYAIRRKLGIWENRSSSFEDNLAVKSWFLLYRPFYKRFIFPRVFLTRPLSSKEESQ